MPAGATVRFLAEEEEQRERGTSCTAAAPGAPQPCYRLVVRRTFFELEDTAAPCRPASFRRASTDSELLLKKSDADEDGDDPSPSEPETDAGSSTGHVDTDDEAGPPCSSWPFEGAMRSADAAAAGCGSVSMSGPVASAMVLLWPSAEGPAASAAVAAWPLVDGPAAAAASQYYGPTGAAGAAGAMVVSGPAVASEPPPGRRDGAPAHSLALDLIDPPGDAAAAAAAPGCRRRGGGRCDGALTSRPPATDCKEKRRTTLMLRNLPNNYTRDMIANLLDEEGFQGLYDFLYLPMDFKTNAALGYAFVNLVSTEPVQRFWETFEGYCSWCVPTNKEAHVSWGGPYQGLKQNLQRYKNSPIMHPSVPDHFKPLYLVNGAPACFPRPTRPVQAPKLRK